jgi:hypothetical protein
VNVKAGQVVEMGLDAMSSRILNFWPEARLPGFVRSNS